MASKPPKVPRVKAASVPPKAVAPKTAKKTLQQEWMDALQSAPDSIWKLNGESAKKLMRWAFSGSQQEAGPYPALTKKTFEDLIHALLDHAMGSCVGHSQLSGKTFGEQLALIAEKAAMSAHSHPGKYVHPDAKELWLTPPGNDYLPFLTARTAGHVRWFSASFSHAPTMTGPAFCFYAQFERVLGDHKEIVCLAQLLARRDPATVSAMVKKGLMLSELSELSEIWRRAFRNENRNKSGSLPTLRWPVFENGAFRYDQITAIPSLSVYNNLKKMRSIASEKGLSLRLSSFSVGSGQAQNISVAATHTSGAIPILLCAPPRIRNDRLGRLQRKSHARNGLITPLTKERLDDLELAAERMRSWPNENRYKNLSYLAKSHAAFALKDCVDLQDAISEDPELANNLPAAASSSLRKALLLTGEPNETDRQYWVSTLYSAAVKKALSAHTADSQDFYENLLWRSIRKELGWSMRGETK